MATFAGFPSEFIATGCPEGPANLHYSVLEAWQETPLRGSGEVNVGTIMRGLSGDYMGIIIGIPPPLSLKHQ